MSPDRKHDIFLSYARKDSDLTRRVRASLMAQRLSVWTDESILPSSPDYAKAIEDAMKSAGCMVCILTPNVPDADGVRNEIKYAQARKLTLKVSTHLASLWFFLLNGWMMFVP